MEKIKILDQEFLLDKKNSTIYASAASLSMCLNVDKSLVYRRAVYLRKIGKINDVKKINISAHKIVFYYNLDQILLICQEFSKIESFKLQKEIELVAEKYFFHKKENINTPIDIINDLKDIQNKLNQIINSLSKDNAEQKKEPCGYAKKHVYNINEAAKILNINRNDLRELLLNKDIIHYSETRGRYSTTRLAATPFGENVGYAKNLHKISKGGETTYQLHITQSGLEYIANDLKDTEDRLNQVLSELENSL